MDWSNDLEVGEDMLDLTKDGSTDTNKELLDLGIDDQVANELISIFQSGTSLILIYFSTFHLDTSLI